MTECQLIAGCPFFNDKMQNLPSTAQVYKVKYCKNDNSNCARYLVFKALGKPKVPLDLLPNQTSRATEIIKKG